MDLGSEISLNFKASIKKKLKESGTYIDDELPEYIMVMIANKRNEYQMKEDLSLFLGDETEKFVTWLFVMLKRLQNAAKVDATNAEAKSTKETQSVLPKNDLVEKEQINPDEVKEPKSTESVIMDDSINDDTNTEIKQKVNIKDDSKSDKKIDRESGDEKDHKTSDNIKEKHKGGKEYSKHRSKSHDKKPKKRHHSRSRSPGRNREDNDGDDRPLSRERKRSSRQRTRSTSSSKKTAVDSHDDQKERNESSQAVASHVSIQKVKPSLPVSRQATGILIKRAIQEANISVQPRASVNNEKENEAENVPFDISVEVKNDRRRFHLKREKKVEEKKEITSRLQEGAEDNQLENDECDAGGKRPRLAQDDGIEVEVPENEFLDEESSTKKRSDQRIVIAHRFDDEAERQCDNEIKDQEENGIDNDYDVMKKPNETTDGKHQSDEEKEEENKGSAEDEKNDRQKRDKRKHRHRRDRSGHSHRDRKQSNTRFVVTLHGALDKASKVEKRKHHRSRRERSLHDEDPLFIDMNPKAPMKILESAQQEIDKMAKKLDFMQNILPPSAVEQYTVPIASNNHAIPPSQTLSTLPVAPARVSFPGNILPGPFDLGHIQTSSLIPQQSLTGVAPLSAPVIVMQNMSDAKITSKPKFKQREIIVPLRVEKDDEFSDADSVGETEEEKTNSVTERCRFWPNCKSSSCQYIHPTIPCRMFPSCSFKDKCIFLHPICKFDNRCTKPACPYTHSQKPGHRKPKSFQNGISLDVSIPICRFYPNCSKLNCSFRHPSSKACRYGSACNRKDCPFHHETRPAIGDSLKWSLNSKNSPKHISDRSFAVSAQEVTSIPVTVSTA